MGFLKSGFTVSYSPIPDLEVGESPKSDIKIDRPPFCDSIVYRPPTASVEDKIFSCSSSEA
jgi:hypothetical protein